jgi:predicted ester cyclase
MKQLQVLALSAATISLFAACGGDSKDPNAEMEARNTATIMAMNDAWISGDIAALDSMISDSYVNHTPDPEWPSSGNDKKDMTDFAATMNAAFTEMSYTISKVVADSNSVGVIGVTSGKNTGDWFGMPATNNSFTANDASFYEFDEDGKVIGSWGVFDAHRMMAQLFPEMGKQMEEMMGGAPADSAGTAPPAEGSH